MLDLVTRTAKLIPYPKRTRAVPGFATAYHYEPEPGQAALGALYAVVEVLAAPKQAEEVVDLVIRSLGEHYYDQAGRHPDHSDDDDKDGDKDVPDETPAKRFEAAIKYVNTELARYTERGNGSWVGRMSAVVAIQIDDQLHLTQTGSAEAYLFRKGTTNLISRDLSPTGPHRPHHTFTQFASGELEAGDRLLITTPALMHHVSKDRLRAIIEHTSPTASAQEISELTKSQDNADRLAALILEVTTPDKLAMQVRSDEPEEVPMGTPESMLGVAKEAATPVVKRSAKTAGEVARKGVGVFKDSVQPKLRSGLLWLVQHLRSLLDGPKGRRNLAVGVVAVGLLLMLGLSLQSQAAGLDKLVGQFDQSISYAHKADDLLAAGDKSGARVQLTNAKAIADKLSHSTRQKDLDKKLAHRPHPESDPNSISALQTQIQSQMDLVDGIVAANLTLISDLAALSPRPTLIATAGSKLLLAATGDNPALATIDPSAGKLTSLPKTTGLGKVVAITPSSSGDGAYILTAEPSVWLYKAADDSLARQNLSQGDWPKGKDIASYAGNIYILADDQIWRHTPTLAGFSQRSAYVSDKAVASLINGATALNVDGSVLVGGGSPPLKRFVQGKLEERATNLPDSLAHPKSVQSLADGSLILTVDASSNRIGLVGFNGQELSFFRQYALHGASQLQAATANYKSKTVYVVADGKLWKFGLSL